MTHPGFKFLKIISWLLGMIVLQLIIFGIAFFLSENPSAALSNTIIVTVIVLLCLGHLWALTQILSLPKTLCLVFFLILMLFVVLAASVVMGIPFGYLRYSSLFDFQILGLIPWTVIGYWLLAILASFGVAYYLFPNALSIMATSVLVVGLNLVSEPAAVSLGLWEWRSVGVYYTSPWINYFSWAIISIVAGIIIWFFNKKKSPNMKMKLFFHTFYLGLVGFWTAICTWQHLWVPAGIGLIIMAGIILQTASLQLYRE